MDNPADAVTGTYIPHCVLIGDPVPGGLAESLARALASNGWVVSLRAWSPPSGIRGSLAARHIFGARIEANRALAKALIGAPSRHDVHLIIVVKGFLLQPSHVRMLRDRFECPIYCWNPDDPTDSAISNSGGGILKTAAEYDGYVTWSSHVATRLSGYVKSVYAIPFGLDSALFFPERHTDLELVTLVSHRPTFVGTWTEERQEFISRLRKFRPVVFGNNWPLCNDITVLPAINGKDLRTVLSRSLVSINLLRPQNLQSHNMRTFEIPGCGGRIATQSNDEILNFYRSDSNVIYFNHADELRSQLEDLDPTSEPIEYSWVKEHTYHLRMQKLLAHIFDAKIHP